MVNERQATRSLMGTLLLPPRLATLKDLQASLPRATFSPSAILLRSMRAKERRVPELATLTSL
jgi:hypothetical protein